MVFGRLLVVGALLGGGAMASAYTQWPDETQRAVNECRAAMANLPAPGDAEQWGAQARDVFAFAKGKFAEYQAALQKSRDEAGAATPALPELRDATHGTYDFVVVGAGIIGLAIARQLMLEYPGKSVCVIEKEGAVAQHQSSHNSGVIHAGLYDAPDKLKTTLAVHGGKLLYEYCEKNKLPCKRVGKLLVAQRLDQLPVLEQYKANAEAAGQTGLSIVVGREEVQKLEPNVEAAAALVSDNTGIVDFAEVARHLAKEVTGAVPLTNLRAARRSGTNKSSTAKAGTILFNKEIRAVDDIGPFVRLTAVEAGQHGPVTSVNARVLVTAAGLHMDAVSRMAGGRSEPAVLPFRGRYYQLRPDKANIVARNIYPIPPFKGDVGVHFTPTVDVTRGPGMIVGPSFSIALDREAYTSSQISLGQVASMLTSSAFWRFSYSLGWEMVTAQVQRDLSKARFVAEARVMVPSLKPSDFETSFTGVMAHCLDREGNTMGDFAFEVTSARRHPALAALGEGAPIARKPVPRVINVRNAPSPAGTSALAIAEHVGGIVESDLKHALLA